MILIDSNIFIYAALPEHAALRSQMHGKMLSVSVISYIEVLGYHQLTPEHIHFLTRLLDMAQLIPLSLPIMDTAIMLRQQHRIDLGDSVIAATALEHNMELWTRNTKDFNWISGLVICDPLSTKHLEQ
ncbi:MAG: type II toxin-antitoxin system VapC family toxin [Magnetococcales bacterium]|nr:type II toxin-antitoxin system VapC family toxin [Magnetococcales bacterium]